MKHTPGPWEMDRETGCIYGPDEEPIMVCGEYAFRYGEGTEEALANNYLFWAAPDLLEAARNLITDVRRRYPGEELRCPYMKALDAAVVKAEGQSDS